MPHCKQGATGHTPTCDCPVLGSGPGPFWPGDPIDWNDLLAVGDLLYESKPSNSVLGDRPIVNILRVVGHTRIGPELAYAVYVNPYATHEKRAPADMPQIILPCSDLYRAVTPKETQ